MEDRRSAFESFFEYIGADEYIKSSPAVAEFLGVTPVGPARPPNCNVPGSEHQYCGTGTSRAR